MKKQDIGPVDRFMNAYTQMRENHGLEERGINEWLSAVLAGGALPTHEVTARAKLAGYKRKDLKRARMELNVQTINAGGVAWLWALPEPTTLGRIGEERRAHVDQD